MIAHCAEHPVLQISKGHVVGKAASVDLSVMVTVRIAANDKHTVSAVTSHVAQTRGLVVEYEVRDCPGHRLTKRVCGGSAMTLLVDQGTGQRYCPLRIFVSRPGDSDEAVRFRDGWERSMAKIRISSTELVWVFHQRLEAYDCPTEVPIAIVPAHDVGWIAVMSAKVRTRYPHWVRRVESIQKQLREIYVLRD
jgi:hypothetical protein